MSGESERADGDGEKCGEEIEWGEGDPRALFVTNLALSIVSAVVTVYSLSYIDLAAFSVVDAASVVLVLTMATYLVVN